MASPSEMVALGCARLDSGKRGREPPPLWESALGTVISGLAEEHLDDLVQMLVGDALVREKLTNELLRRAKHVPDLGDTDVVEFVTLPVVEQEAWIGGLDLAVCAYRTMYCTVGRLPYWLNAALKTQFKERCGAAPVPQKRARANAGEGCVTRDGRLQFELVEDDFDTVEPLAHAYIEHITRLAIEECIPSKEAVGYKDTCDDVDLDDVAPGVQPDTALYDAWDLCVNGAEDRLLENVNAQFAHLFELHMAPDAMSPEARKMALAMTAGEASVSTVWVRKPRVRITLHPSAE